MERKGKTVPIQPSFSSHLGGLLLPGLRLLKRALESLGEVLDVAGGLGCSGDSLLGRGLRLGDSLRRSRLRRNHLRKTKRGRENPLKQKLPHMQYSKDISLV